MSNAPIERAALSGAAQGPWARVATAVLAAVLFAVACLCPAVRVGGYGLSLLGPWEEVHTGLTALLFGWLTEYLLAWLANPFFLAGWVALLGGECRRAARLGAGAVALGLTAWLGFVATPDVTPPSTGLSGLYAGYYLWLGSMLVLVIGAVVVGRSTAC